MTTTHESIKHSTPNALMDRVLDVSFDTIQSRVDLMQPAPGTYNENDQQIDNRDMIKDIADGNITFRFFVVQVFRQNDLKPAKYGLSDKLKIRFNIDSPVLKF